MPPLAYLLTWTTYGTWLHGDDRGSVDREHNTFDTPFVPASPGRRVARVDQLAAQVVTLTADQRRVVHETIDAHCAHRGWRLIEANVRTNHVHAVIAAPVEPEVIVNQCKGWCTRRLREAGLVGADQPVWTEGGSKRYLWDDESLARARHYVRNEQGPDL